MNFSTILVIVFFIIVFVLPHVDNFLVLPPYWNIPTRSTRGMSYDIRGDIPPTYSYVGPWNNSERAPYYDPRLDYIDSPLWRVD